MYPRLVCHFFSFSKHSHCFLTCRIKHCQAELKKKKSELKATEKEYDNDKEAFDTIEKGKAKLEVKIVLTL